MAFKPGESGNPAGRPAGGTAAQRALRAQIMSEAPTLIATAINKAIEGDMFAMRLCLERILPKAKETLAFDLPDLSHGDADRLVRELFVLMSHQSMTADEIKSVLDLVRTFRKEDDESKHKELLERSDKILDELREKYKKEDATS